jgi:hypothetical protein
LKASRCESKSGSVAQVSIERLGCMPRHLIVMIKHLMGVVGVILAAWGFGFLHTAFFTSYGVWWDQGTMGVACWIGAFAIHRRWFRRAPNE